jgi:hypothetical protein
LRGEKAGRNGDVDKGTIRRIFWRAYHYEGHFLENLDLKTSRQVGELCPIELRFRENYLASYLDYLLNGAGHRSPV